MTDVDGTAARLAGLAASATKPVLASWIGGATLAPARRACSMNGLHSRRPKEALPAIIGRRNTSSLQYANPVARC
ncbi:MAG TPA: hypothetical protein VIT91_20645 [Chthoniobacterales bacterium]